MINDTKSINNLLRSVTQVKKHYDEVSKLKGEHFNLFSVIRKENDEVIVHNRMIAELLNPEGSHGLGDIPLHSFIDYISAKSTFSSLDQTKQQAIKAIKNNITKPNKPN